MRYDRECANISQLGASNREFPQMCDYSLQNVRSRPAKVGDKLVTRDFGTGTRGFAAADELQLAVCVSDAGNGTGLRPGCCMPAKWPARVD